MSLAVVIGVGRSGTSLAMQALDKLGYPVLGTTVPASENNLRGTGESLALRDRLFKLHKALGGPRGFLPDDWQRHPEARATLNWLARYMRRGAVKDEGRKLAMKFPISALYLPLMTAAADRAGVKPVWIWASRPPAEIISSLMRSYKQDSDHAAAVWAQRSFHLLRDAPDDTFFLPYSGWRKDPNAQVDYLAQLLDVTDAERIAAAKGCFSATLDHARDAALELPETVAPAVAQVSALIAGRRGRLSDVMDRNAIPYFETMGTLADTINRLVPEALLTKGEAEMRLAILDRYSQDPVKEADMKDEIEVLANRIRAVSAENTRLRQEIDAEQGSVAAAPPASPAAAHAQSAELVALREALAKAEAKIEEQAGKLESNLAQIQQQRDSYQALAQLRDEAEEDAETTHRAKLGSAEMRANRFERVARNREAEIEKLKQRLAALRDQLPQSEHMLEQTALQLAESEAERARMLASKSWRITAPLRGFRRIFSR